MIDTNAIRAKIADIAVMGELTADYISESNIDIELLDMGIIPGDIAEEDIPYSLKDRWRWVRVADLGADTKNSFADGPFGSNLKREHYTTDKQVRIIQLSNVGELGWRDDNEKYTTYEHLETIKRSEVEPGNIVIAKMMPAGRAIVVPDVSDKYVLSSDCVKFVPNDKLNVRYLCHAINSQMFRKQVLKDVHGIGRERTSLSKLKSYLLPIPPVDEQQVIVKRIDAIFSLLNIIDNLQSQYASDLEVLKSKLIDAGIRGKLTEQLPEDGDAEDLYNQIQDEKAGLIKEGKIKKEKPLPDISEDEIPFEIPKSWKWTRFGNVISLLSGTDFKPEEYNDRGIGTVYITGASNLDENGVLISRWTETPRNITYQGDVLLVCKGSGYGKTVICDIKEAHIARQIMSVKKMESLDMRFVKYFLDANFAYLKSKGQGVIPGIDRNTVLNMTFPLPPYEEQKRIAAKLEKIMPYCKKLSID